MTKTRVVVDGNKYNLGTFEGTYNYEEDVFVVNRLETIYKDAKPFNSIGASNAFKKRVHTDTE